MNNKEFVEGLISILNEINRDKLRFRRIDETRYNQKFILKESIHKVRLESGETKLIIQVDLVLKSRDEEGIITNVKHISNPIKEEDVPKELLDNIYINN